MTNSSSPEPVDLTDPAIEPLRLQQLAQTHPHLWNDILQHPNVYPGLADWIHDRQAEQAAAAPQTQYPAEDVSQHVADDETSVDVTAEETDGEIEDFPTEAPTEQPAPTNSWFQHPSPEQFEPTEQPYQAPAAEEPTQTFGQAQWAQPAEPLAPQQQFSATSPQDSGQVNPGYGQPSYGFPQQQTPGYQQQPQQSQPQFGQPYMRQSRGASKIDLSSRSTWGLFIAGGAAFLALFGFFFNPSVAPTSVLGVSHFSSGGWFLMLLLIATVAMSVIDLLMPNRWTRYAFVALGIGTAFALIGRYMTIMGILDGYRIGFSLVWVIFMAMVLLAGTMVYFAPGSSQAQPRPQQPQQPPQQFQQNQQFQQYQQNPPFNQPGGYPQSGQFPQGGYGQEPQQFGGYQPPQQPGSPQ
ncbi:variant leucine-rich repeat-containing protein [Yaniella halotolerans]|uniref:variant leucine-rich repeat-containing protein n=1 Tax=Yaniella halotolerans TaxID=225453 RepID=UPI0003B5CE54|nr:hypothetical protein [Yaniella halotolerans]